MANSTLQTLYPFLTETNSKTSSGGTVKSYIHVTGSGPVVCLVHGYPESSYMWRHVVPLIKDKMTLFIPELPGYGFSSLPPKSDKRTVGNLIMEALQTTFGKDCPVIWCGHDRGARVGHRLLVDNNPAHNIIAAILMDIVPTTEQWRSFANPAAAVAYYHWPFLATPAASHLIEAMGGSTYIENNFSRIVGKGSEGANKFKENDAVAHYSAQFSRSETIQGSCADYAAGANEDVREQMKDQEEGRKVKVPAMVIYSASNLGEVHDVDGIWKKWHDGELQTVGIGDGFGHFLPEECPDRIARLIGEWYEKYRG